MAVLEALSALVMITSEVKYSTIWHNGQVISIRNGDQNVYMTEMSLTALPEILEVGEYKARVFKLTLLMKCK